jgi:hypothetical protein
MDKTINGSIGSTKSIFMLLMVLSISSFAARPYLTDDPGTTEFGNFELEAAADYWRNSVSPSLLFKHGITDRMELDIPIGYTLMPEDERSIAPLQLYAKFAIIPNIFAMTFTSALSDKVYSVISIFGKSIGAFNFNLNLGGSMVGEADDADLTYGLCGMYTIGKIESGAELGGTQEGLNWWEVGAKFFIAEWFSIDAGIGGDFEKEMNFSATTGLMFIFPVLKAKKGE